MKRNSFRSEAGLQPIVLKPQDVAIALKILVLENQDATRIGCLNSIDVDPVSDLPDAPTFRSWTLAELAKAMHISIGEVHNALNRLTESSLLRSEGRRINRRALEEFLVHGVRYAFPAARGATVRGIPTAYAAPVLKGQFLSSGQDVPVWPHPEGTMRGIAFSSLYNAAPSAALEDDKFYELLAITDVLRGDFRARERAVATQLLQAQLADGKLVNGTLLTQE
jgi:DNA-binding Lrp family transcriptional regulator